VTGKSGKSWARKTSKRNSQGGLGKVGDCWFPLGIFGRSKVEKGSGRPEPEAAMEKCGNPAEREA